MAASEKQEEIFYVGIKDPIEARRNILESTKDSIQILQRLAKFKALRAEKSAVINRLREDLRELNKLVNRLRTELPKTKLRVRLEEHEKLEASKEYAEKTVAEITARKALLASKKKEAEKPKKEMTEIEKLESELGNIEQKLKNLI